MTSRFREELGRRRGLRQDGQPSGDLDRADIEAAIRITVATAGRAVFFSGLTVLLGLTGLILFDFPILRSVGIAGAIVVGMAVLAALTLLPAILAVLGPRLDALRVRRVDGGDGSDGRWARLARRVMRHPVAVFVPTLAFLLLLGAPFLHVRFNAPDATILPPEIASRAAFDTPSGGSSERAGSRPLSLAIRTTGQATSAANVVACSTTTRAGSRRTRESSASTELSMLTPACRAKQYQLILSARPADPPTDTRPTRWPRTTRGDLTAFTVITNYAPNRPEAPRGPGQGPARSTSDPLSPAPRASQSSPSGVVRSRSSTWSTASRSTSRRPGCSSS